MLREILIFSQSLSNQRGPSLIMSVLKQLEAGVTVAELSREHNVSTVTLYQWRANYGGMDTSMIKRLKELEAENARLKKMYAEERIKAEIRKDVIEEKL